MPGEDPAMDIDDTHTAQTEPARPGGRSLDSDGWIAVVLVAALVMMVLVTGLNFTFAAAVMPNLADADDRTFVEIMQRYNDNPVFQITYTVALVLAVVAVVLHRRNRAGAAVRWNVAALVLYVLVFVGTIAINVPLNYEIDDAGDPGRATAAELTEVRDDVEAPWVTANIVRTVLSTAGVAALAWAVYLHGRSTAKRDARAGAGVV